MCDSHVLSLLSYESRLANGRLKQNEDAGLNEGDTENAKTQ